MSRGRLFVSSRAFCVGGGGVLFGYVVAAMLMLVGRLAMMMSGGFVMRRCGFVMLSRRVLIRSHQYVPLE